MYPFAGYLNPFSALVSSLWMTATDLGGCTKFLFLSTFISQLFKPHFEFLSLSMDVLYTGNRPRNANKEGGTYSWLRYDGTFGSCSTEQEVFRSRMPLPCLCQCSRGIRNGSGAARLLELWIRIPPPALISVCCNCCMLSGWGLCFRLIIHPKEILHVCVRPIVTESFENEKTLTQ
jgi:hypothetical protein